MRVVIQRVKASKVVVDAVDIASIDLGMVILLGIETDDNTTDVDWLVAKISGLRIFEDAEGKMNLDINDVGGSFLVISQFTLHASTKKRQSAIIYQSSKTRTSCSFIRVLY
ncbi:MAG: D-tyrosyl-tRNA(Tyr) deacylase [Bacteroidetes bacterium OLB9]|nr:MAG: D-tyrosyl-tRNA(Tyr) deacylase [Bacteroidetes bacterium OLB9]